MDKRHAGSEAVENQPFDRAFNIDDPSEIDSVYAESPAPAQFGKLRLTHSDPHGHDAVATSLVVLCTANCAPAMWIHFFFSRTHKAAAITWPKGTSAVHLSTHPL